ncbi:IclR family transcriptional regulator [Streptomyces sp. NPDC004629]|uniref:IclR family transcriptional regulator n=1 Tax=Streptomyces sp. NPDC004629 TaxID=3364705 RepID=UPI0036C2B710
MSSMPSALQILNILRYLAEHPSGARASVMSVRLGLPRSTTYRLLGLMVEEGFALHHPADQTFGLGAAAYEIANSYDCDTTIQRLGRPTLTDLVVERFPEAVAQLSVLRNRETMHLLRISGKRAPVTLADVGVRLPAQLTATGRAMLGYHSHAHTRALFSDPACLTRRTDRGPTTLRELRHVLQCVRALGWAREDSEVGEGLASVAAPVLDPTGFPIAAVGLTFRQDELDDLCRARAAEACQIACRQIAYQLHGARVKFHRTARQSAS